MRPPPDIRSPVPDDRKAVRLLAILAAALVALVGIVVGTSPVTCPMVPSMDTCRMIPFCSHTYIDGLDGPSWSCDPKYFGRR